MNAQQEGDLRESLVKSVRANDKLRTENELLRDRLRRLDALWDAFVDRPMEGLTPGAQRLRAALLLVAKDATLGGPQ